MRRTTLTVVVLALAVGVASAAGARRDTFGAGTRTFASPVVYGYPYDSNCPGAGIAEIVDRWGMFECNCTSYVAWALVVNHQRIDWFIPGAMDARNWPHVARLASLRVDHKPARGAVVVWPATAKPFGHVAYVTGLDAEGTIDVAEYNDPSPGGGNTFVFDVRTLVGTAGAVFIHVPHVARRSSFPTESRRR